MNNSLQLQTVESEQRARDMDHRISIPPKGLLYYLCLQATREGQASFAHVHEIIRGLERRGWDVKLFQPTYAAHQRPVGIVQKLWEFVALQAKLFWIPRRPDVLYIRDHVALLPSYIWARLRHIPIVVEVNGSFAGYATAYPATRALRALIFGAGRLCFRLSNAVIGVTPELCAWVQSEVGSKPTFLVPNGANTDLFRPEVERQPGLPDLYVVFVGAFSAWQGIDTMLKAVNSPEWPSKVKLVLVGSGFEQAKVERAAAENANIVYLGQRPYREIPGIVAGALAGISAKSNPGGWTDNYSFSPLKVFETLACGVPCIVTDVPGQYELIRDQHCGLVISQNDPSALAQSVAYLFHHRSDCEDMGRRGRQIVEESHSWQHSADLTEAAILQVLGR